MTDIPVVELQDVTKVYHMPAGDVYALNHVNFSVKKGEFVAITGPSGSGKSTLMNMIGCIGYHKYLEKTRAEEICQGL